MKRSTSEAPTGELVFLKLGGSLITVKERPGTPRPETINRLASEIARARQKRPALRLLLGHGSGSFGHVPAQAYRTRAGVYTPDQWRGFLMVWRQARALNRLVMQAFEQAGLPALALPPSAAVVATDGRVTAWHLEPLRATLEVGLLPVVYGDVVFDTRRGGTILSTEDLFCYLASHLNPARILLAGLEAGVWADYPGRTRLVDEVTPVNQGEILPALGDAQGADVTGGMTSKVTQMLALVEANPGLEVHIFSGETPGAVERALLGMPQGTRLWAPAATSPNRTV